MNRSAGDFLSVRLNLFTNVFRQPEEAAVPRRFGAGGLFVLVTIYCIFFRALTLLDIPPPLVLAYAIFLTGVSGAQAIVFAGTRPRTASFLAGGYLAAGILLVAAIDEWTIGISGMKASYLGCNTPWRVLSGMIVLWFFGRPCGYVVGCFTAGVFLLFDRWRNPYGHTPTISSTIAPNSGKTGRAWFHPIQRDRPVRGALGAFIWMCILGFVVAPFQPESWVVFGVTCVFALLAAYWTGTFQLRARFWISLSLLAAMLALIPGIEMQRSIEIGLGDAYPYLIYISFLIVGLMLGLSLLAALGWVQRFLTWRNGTDVEISNRWLSAFVVAVFAITTWCGMQGLYYWQQSPSQRVCQLVEATGGSAYMNVWQPTLTVYGMNIGTQVTDQHAHDLRLQGLTVPWVQFEDAGSLASEGFADVACLATQYLAAGRGANDGHVRQMAQQGFTATNIDLRGTDITDEGLTAIANADNASRISQLTLSGTSVSAAGLRQLNKLAVLTHLTLDEGTAVDAEAIQAIADNCPFLQTLKVNATAIDDAAIQPLAKLTTLRWLGCRDTHVTLVGENQLREQNLNIAVER